jgi:hypothetical protein
MHPDDCPHPIGSAGAPGAGARVGGLPRVVRDGSAQETLHHGRAAPMAPVASRCHAHRRARPPHSRSTGPASAPFGAHACARRQPGRPRPPHGEGAGARPGRRVAGHRGGTGDADPRAQTAGGAPGRGPARDDDAGWRRHGRGAAGVAARATTTCARSAGRTRPIPAVQVRERAGAWSQPDARARRRPHDAARDDSRVRRAPTVTTRRGRRPAVHDGHEATHLHEIDVSTHRQTDASIRLGLVAGCRPRLGSRRVGRRAVSATDRFLDTSTSWFDDQGRDRCGVDIGTGKTWRARAVRGGPG